VNGAQRTSEANGGKSGELAAYCSVILTHTFRSLISFDPGRNSLTTPFPHVPASPNILPRLLLRLRQRHRRTLASQRFSVKTIQQKRTRQRASQHCRQPPHPPPPAYSRSRTCLARMFPPFAALELNESTPLSRQRKVSEPGGGRSSQKRSDHAMGEGAVNRWLGDWALIPRRSAEELPQERIRLLLCCSDFYSFASDLHKYIVAMSMLCASLPEPKMP